MSQLRSCDFEKVNTVAKSLTTTIDMHHELFVELFDCFIDLLA
jgi:hypothetical protein